MASLQELPDDELDKLFRSSAEEFEPPYNPDDWTHLRRRLDDDDLSRFFDRLIYWGLPLLLLVLSAVSILAPAIEVGSAVQTVANQPKPYAHHETGTPATRSQELPTVSPATRAEHSETTPSTETGTSTRSEAGKVEQNDTETITENTPTKRNVVQPETARDISANLLRSRNERTESATSPHSASRSLPKTQLTARPEARTKAGGSSARRPVLGKTALSATTRNHQNVAEGTDFPTDAGIAPNRTEQPNAGSTVPPPDGDGHSNNPLSARPNSEPTVTTTTPLELSGKFVDISARAPQSPALPALPEPELRPVINAPETAAPLIPVVGYPALSIRVVAAPNRNFVGNSRQGANDLSLGILAEYRFLRRFTIQSGVIRSVKKYTAPASEYTMPDTIAKHWYGPYYESVGAICRILDIPVNLRYDVLLNDRRRWFINAGVSSYIMQQETYVYNYPPGTKPSTQQKYKGWSGKTGLHPFSHINFSVGYERNFRPDGFLRRVSWQVEPFLKKPLSDLGYGKIRLRSAGVFFSLRYRL
ncbi:hypothetical protein GCM10027347_34930 [Larkinella harenae]